MTKRFVVHTRKHRVDQLKSLVYLLADFSTGKDDLAADEYQKDDLGLHHTVDQTREKLGFIGAEVVMARCKSFQANGEFDITRADDVLDLEVRELGVKSELLNNTSVFARREFRVIFRLGTSNDHLARSKDQSSGLGFTNTHDDGSETLDRNASLVKVATKDTSCL